MQGLGALVRSRRMCVSWVRLYILEIISWGWGSVFVSLRFIELASVEKTGGGRLRNHGFLKNLIPC